MFLNFLVNLCYPLEDLKTLLRHKTFPTLSRLSPYTCYQERAVHFKRTVSVVDGKQFLVPTSYHLIQNVITVLNTVSNY